MNLRVLIVDDESAARFGLSKALARMDCEITQADAGMAALKCIAEGSPDLVFLDLNMPDMSGLEVLRQIDFNAFAGEVIVVTADDSAAAAVTALQRGATDYLTKPYDVERLRAIARRNQRRVRMQHQLDRLRDQLNQEAAFGALVGVSQPMRHLFAQLPRAAAAPLDILICGETGTGKELIARELHRLSGRATGPFVAVNTAAISESLAESQLFGHVKGAFTGAGKDHKGVFEQAQGGTLFLDEIGDMPLALQTKILRALQERTVQPLGSSKTVAIDVRVVSATHQSLHNAMQAGEFREDLYFRLKGIELTAPPLRERREDIILLADYFLGGLEIGKDIVTAKLSQSAIDCLLSYHWPGNVRELKQVVVAAAVMGEGEIINARDLELGREQRESAAGALPSIAGLPFNIAKARVVEWFERNMISDALRANAGNISATARQLGIHRQSLQQKMSQLNLDRTGSQ